MVWLKYLSIHTGSELLFKLCFSFAYWYILTELTFNLTQTITFNLKPAKYFCCLKLTKQAELKRVTLVVYVSSGSIAIQYTTTVPDKLLLLLPYVLLDSLEFHPVTLATTPSLLIGCLRMTY